MEILISGASTGIGKATAIHFARNGHSVWAGVRSAKSFDAISKLNVNGLRPLFLDVCDEHSIRAALSEIRAKSGMLHALVNNAGLAISGPIEAIPLEDWRRQFETNVFGQIRLTQECLPSLRESKGRIVMVSSISGRVSSPYLGAYAASKFALEAVSDALRREVAAQGIRVAVIEPGPIATPIWEKSKTEGLQKIEAYPAAMRDIYAKGLARFQEYIEGSIRSAAPVSVCVRAIEHALLATYPKTRYPVGRGIRSTALVSRVIPDAWLDKIMATRI